MAVGREDDYQSSESWDDQLPDDSDRATMAEADREYASNVGSQRPDLAWILSDRDVWYRNPYYMGVPQPHPEDCNGE